MYDDDVGDDYSYDDCPADEPSEDVDAYEEERALALSGHLGVDALLEWSQRELRARLRLCEPIRRLNDFRVYTNMYRRRRSIETRCRAVGSTPRSQTRARKARQRRAASRPHSRARSPSDEGEPAPRRRLLLARPRRSVGDRR